MTHGNLMDFLSDFRGRDATAPASVEVLTSEPSPPPAEPEPTRSAQPAILGQLRSLAVSAPPAPPEVDPRTGIPPTESLFVQPRQARSSSPVTDPPAQAQPIAPPAQPPAEARPSRSPVVRPPAAATGRPPAAPPAAKPAAPPAGQPPGREAPASADLQGRQKGERSEWLTDLLSLDWQENREASASLILGIAAIFLPLLAIPSVILAVGCLRRLPVEPWRKGKARAHAAIVASAVLAPISLAVWISFL